MLKTVLVFRKSKLVIRATNVETQKCYGKSKSVTLKNVLVLQQSKSVVHITNVEMRVY